MLPRANEEKFHFDSIFTLKVRHSYILVYSFITKNMFDELLEICFKNIYILCEYDTRSVCLNHIYIKSATRCQTTFIYFDAHISNFSTHWNSLYHWHTQKSYLKTLLNSKWHLQYIIGFVLKWIYPRSIHIIFFHLYNIAWYNNHDDVIK